MEPKELALQRPDLGRTPGLTTTIPMSRGSHTSPLNLCFFICEVGTVSPT